MLLAPLSNAEYEDLMADKPVSTLPPQPCEIQLRRCSCCREYAPAGSLANGASLCCHAPLAPAVL